MRTLLIDNYDSYTFNLYQVIAEVTGVLPLVVRNDEATWAELQELPFAQVVISPGPGRPDRVADFGCSREALLHAEVPVLGVCLGHQGLGALYGAEVVHAPEVMHGRLSAVYHDGSDLFRGVPQGFRVVRYHSLMVRDPLPDVLQKTAWTPDGVIMGLSHREKPLWGVQFHPESICTEFGKQVMVNFYEAAEMYRGRKSRGFASFAETSTSQGSMTQQGHRQKIALPAYQVKYRRLDAYYDPETAFVHLYAQKEHAFWLDSSKVTGESRFSFMGTDDGPLSHIVSYDVNRQTVDVTREGGSITHQESIFDTLERSLAGMPVAGEGPVPFTGGFVGFLGYEVKADCGGENKHRSQHPDAMFLFADRFLAFDMQAKQTYLVALVPQENGAAAGAEAWFAEMETLLGHLPALEQEGNGKREAVLEETGNLQEDLKGTSQGASQKDNLQKDNLQKDNLQKDNLQKDNLQKDNLQKDNLQKDNLQKDNLQAPLHATLNRPYDAYRRDIDHIKRLLTEGETYEVNLTNEIELNVSLDPMQLYRTLRRVNPAPYAAYLRFGELSVLCSSPERFITVDAQGHVEAKPIKGTTPRGRTAEEDQRLKESLRTREKDRAENLMIVDLLRNDLGRVCEIGSVSVPKLMEVESFETVHQLVSTIRGTLPSDTSAVGCLKAAFPGGSMTGAPKIRTMQIIDDIEGRARGVYSGAIGYFSTDGAADFNIVIRTIVMVRDHVTIGTGGAIVIQSDAEGEYEEMLLKARAPLRAIAETAGTTVEQIRLSGGRAEHSRSV